MLYALIGVPLMLMCLSSLGGFLAEALQCVYSRLCGSAGKRSHNHQDHEDHDNDDDVYAGRQRTKKRPTTKQIKDEVRKAIFVFSVDSSYYFSL